MYCAEVDVERGLPGVGMPEEAFPGVGMPDGIPDGVIDTRPLPGVVAVVAMADTKCEYFRGWRVSFKECLPQTRTW